MADLLTPEDLHFFREGSHCRLYRKLGAHPEVVDGAPGYRFQVWAPQAQRVSLIGEMNDWHPRRTPMHPWQESGIWQVFVPRAQPGMRYKFHIVSRLNGQSGDKADPFCFAAEIPPLTASRVVDRSYRWSDGAWMARRAEYQALSRPISVYEVHLGSWKRSPEHPERLLSYGQIAHELVPYVRDMGFTHVELLPVMEHPFYGSWGYQVTGYFAPTSRYGSPEELKSLIEAFHHAGIGVILDWVPGHFPSDEHGLAYFDGTHLFEHADPRLGFHPEWNSLIFNYGRGEVRSFLISSALYWLDEFHLDGLRIDGVASMLYLDYARMPGEWLPNEVGGRENLHAVTFLRALNEAIHREYPDVLVIAEDSTSWPKVTRPFVEGGLGFDLKWDMGWMHDILDYLSFDPLHRKHHHNNITFRSVYSYKESYHLALSHDEVVHGKYSLLGKMHGDRRQSFAHLRLLFGYMIAQPGKKLLFMGGEFGQVKEWNHDASLDWHLLDQPDHREIQAWVAALQRMYRSEPSLYAGDVDASGFEWLDGSDFQNSVIVFLRKAPEGGPVMLVACNFTPVFRPDYWVGVPHGGKWATVLNSDDALYGGEGRGPATVLHTDAEEWHGRPHKLRLDLPPLGVLFLRSEDPKRPLRRLRQK